MKKYSITVKNTNDGNTMYAVMRSKKDAYEFAAYYRSRTINGRKYVVSVKQLDNIYNY